MRLLIFPLILLPAFARRDTAQLSPRQFLPTAHDVNQDVLNIHNAVVSLDRTPQSSNGGSMGSELVQGVPIMSGGLAIHNANRLGLIHAAAALPFGIQDSITIVNTVVSSVNKSIPTSIQHIKEKQPVFKKSGQSMMVISSLALFLSDHDTFSDAVLSKLNKGIGQTKMQEGRYAVANIHNVIQEAIDFYTTNALT